MGNNSFLPYSGGDMYESMNESVRRANADVGRRRQAGWDFEDRMRSQALDAEGNARADRRYEFDGRMNALREMLGRKAPDFFAGAPAQPQGRDETLTTGIHSGMGGNGRRRPSFAGGFESYSGNDLGIGPDAGNFLRQLISRYRQEG